MEFERRAKHPSRTDVDDLDEKLGREKTGPQSTDARTTAGELEDVGEESMSADAGRDQPTSSTLPRQDVPHNLAIASALAQQGDELGAALMPLRLSSIRIEGARNSRPSFLMRLCRPYVDHTLLDSSLAPINTLIYGNRLNQVKPGQPTSLPALLSLLGHVGTDVGSLPSFSDVSASLEPSRLSGGAASTNSIQEDVDIVLRCKERSRLFAKSSTEVGNGEGTAAIQATMRNVFGGAETADVSATIGTRTRRAFNAAFSTPVFALSDHTFTLSAFAQDRDLSSFASATEGVRGVRLAFKWITNGGGNFGSTAAAGVHELAYDVSHRHLARLKDFASLSMRRLAGHSVKSSISHTYTRDLRDSLGLHTPTAAFLLQGSMFKSIVEYAGLGGDANFVKAEVETQYAQCFGAMDQLGISTSGRFGLLASVNGRAPAFSDRFQLGGPTSLRMFAYNSLGPKDGLDSLGGEAYAAIGTSVLSPLWPGKAHWPVKWHAFVNGGQLVQLSHQQPNVSSWLRTNGTLMFNEIICKPSCSAGVGILLRQGALRAEFNVGVPLTMRKGDGARKGIQLGIGIDFL